MANAANVADAGAGDNDGRPGSWVEKASAVAGVLLTVAALTLDRILVFGLLAAMALPWVAVSLRPERERLKYVLAGALTVVLAGAALTVLYYQSHPGKLPAAGARPSPSSASAASRPRFLPVTGPIPHCVSFAGTGSVPAGDALVLFDRATDSAGHYTPTSTFSFDGAAAISPGHGWTAPDLDIGSGDPSDEGSRIAIVAVLMPQHVATFLTALADRSDSGALPPNVMSLGTTADRLVVVRNAQNAHC